MNNCCGMRIMRLLPNPGEAAKRRTWSACMRSSSGGSAGAAGGSGPRLGLGLLFRRQAGGDGEGGGEESEGQ